MAPEDRDNKQDPVLIPAMPPNSEDKSSVFKPHPHRLLKLLTIIIIILILGLGALLGWLWWRDRNNQEETPAAESSQEETAEEEAPVCEEDFKVYVNEDLGVQFCYPIAWGEVGAADAKFAAEDEGLRWRLSFTEKEQVNAGLVSDDWSTEVPRDFTCVDPAVQTMPEFTPFSTDWDVEIETDTTPPQPSSAVRGIEMEEDLYLIQERVDGLLTNGVCLSGYAVTGGEIYPFVTANYSASFNDEVTSPAQHIANPNTLIPAIDRNDFAVFVKSIRQLEM